MISLELWARRFQPSPNTRTLQAWARTGKIYPIPVKIGRAYYVNEKAKHIAELGQPADLVSRIG